MPPSRSRHCQGRHPRGHRPRPRLFLVLVIGGPPRPSQGSLSSPSRPSCPCRPSRPPFVLVVLLFRPLGPPHSPCRSRPPRSCVLGGQGRWAMELRTECVVKRRGPRGKLAPWNAPLDSLSVELSSPLYISGPRQGKAAATPRVSVAPHHADCTASRETLRGGCLSYQDEPPS